HERRIDLPELLRGARRAARAIDQRVRTTGLDEDDEFFNRRARQIHRHPTAVVGQRDSWWVATHRHDRRRRRGAIDRLVNLTPEEAARAQNEIGGHRIPRSSFDSMTSNSSFARS